MPGASLARATIMNLDKGGPPIACHFNPNEYSFSKQNSWTIVSTGGSNVPQVEFGGGQPAQLQMQLLFDTYAEGKDVRKEYTDKLWELMLVDESLIDPKSQRGRPPQVRFQWGSSWSFDAVIASISQRFVLFLSDGTPVRATLDVAFQQIKDERLFPRQNPTSGGLGGERVVTVLAGDTLRMIAYRAYGSVGEWRRIAEANRLDNLRTLQPGLQLRIPPRSAPAGGPATGGRRHE
ncbi:LysM peptidoglycan-binding domain-containing protein [Oscillochloris sp. ZM17-4]|uniref:CIS tube protein n=1 Tax=Oscillochloris sp. ZM17-4 TaxID=2866714 RepID=UPI001C72DE97|nr:LysM peptidoglycan-binding domain-containing protein [Oscillochloris sp. ZM17-4]MBX0331210.1 LysM peptidoglycan-binding domain-containing protein [Oscillochloris sp. ZM17-4]